MIWIILIITLIWLFYKNAVRPLSIWKDMGVKYEKPYPLVGNSYKLAMKQQSFANNNLDMYKKFPTERYNGYFQFVTPVLIIRELELIKQITIKYSDYFIDHNAFSNSDDEPLCGKNLFNLSGQAWRHMRGTVSPSFTSSKIRAMSTMISDCAEQCTDYFLENSADGSIQEINLKDTFTRYSNDVIATCAFGVKCNSLQDKENEFFMMAKDLTNFGGLRSFKFLLFRYFSRLVKVLKLRLYPTYLTNFFINIVKNTIDVRTKNKIVRPDIIHLMMEARKGNIGQEEHQDSDNVSDKSDNGKSKGVYTTDLTDMDIAAQAVIFCFAGFETTSTALCFMSHELAVNPSIQERLRDEIDACFENCNQKVTYESIMKIEYLDMVISETLRKWPPTPGLDRACTKEFTIAPVLPGEVKVVLHPGTHVLIPIIGIHRDEKYFPYPERFDPERFSEANKHKIVPYTYVPFGIGPRNCIASRFALMEIKILFVNLLRKFEIVVTNKTSISFKLSPNSIFMAPENGFWLGLKARKISKNI